MPNLFTAILEQIGLPGKGGITYTKESLEEAIENYNKSHKDSNLVLEGDILHVNIIKPIIIPSALKEVSIKFSIDDFDDVDPKHLVHQHSEFPPIFNKDNASLGIENPEIVLKSSSEKFNK